MFDVELDRSIFLYEKGLALVVILVCPHQRNNFSTASDHFRLRCAYILVVLKWEGFQGVDPLRPTVFRDGKLYQSFAKIFAVEIQLATFHTIVLRPIHFCLFFSIVKDQASLLANSEGSCINNVVRLEQSSQQGINDLVVLQKRSQRLCCGLVFASDIVDQ